MRVMSECNLAFVGQGSSEPGPRLSLSLGLHRKTVYNCMVWKCSQITGWKVSERTYKLNLCVKWDMEGLVIPLQLDSHPP